MDVLIQLSSYFSDTAIFMTVIGPLCTVNEGHVEGYMNWRALISDPVEF